MTEKNDLEVKTKKLIRSVLLCKQEGCPLGKFAHEYQEFTGEPIPFKRLGYISLERCLQSMPDVVDFKKVNGQTILSAVSDNQTRHIDALVKGQRPNTKRAFVRHNGGRQKFSTNQRGQSKVLPFQVVSKITSLVKNHPEVSLNKHIIQFTTLNACISFSSESAPRINQLVRKDSQRVSIFSQPRTTSSK